MNSLKNREVRLRDDVHTIENDFYAKGTRFTVTDAWSTVSGIALTLHLLSDKARSVDVMESEVELCI